MSKNELLDRLNEIHLEHCTGMDDDGSCCCGLSLLWAEIYASGVDCTEAVQHALAVDLPPAGLDTTSADLINSPTVNE